MSRKTEKIKPNRIFLFKNSLLLGFASITLFYGIFFVIIKLISLKFTVGYAVSCIVLFLVTFISLYILLRVKPHKEMKLYSKIRGTYKYEKIEFKEFCKFLPLIFAFSLIGYLANNYPSISRWILYAIFFAGVAFTVLLKPDYEKIRKAEIEKRKIPLSTRAKDSIISILGIFLGVVISAVVLLVLLILE